MCKVSVLEAGTTPHAWSATGRSLFFILMMTQLIKLDCDVIKFIFENDYGQL